MNKSEAIAMLRNALQYDNPAHGLQVRVDSFRQMTFEVLEQLGDNPRTIVPVAIGVQT